MRKSGRPKRQELIAPAELRKQRLLCFRNGNPFRCADAAQLVGVHERTWRMWENGEFVMDPDKLALWRARSAPYRADLKPPRPEPPGPFEMPLDMPARGPITAPAPSPDPPRDPSARAAWDAQLARELAALRANPLGLVSQEGGAETDAPE